MYVSGEKTGGVHYQNELNKAREIIDYILKNSVENEQDENGNQVYKARGEDGFLCYTISKNGEEKISCEYKGDNQFAFGINEFSIEIINGELSVGNGKTGFILRENGEIESNSDLFSLPGASSKTIGNSSTLIEAYDNAFKYARGMEYRMNRDFPRDTTLYTILNEFEEFYTKIIGKNPEKDRRQQLKEIINEGKPYNPEELTNEDLDIILELFLVDDYKDGKTIREIGMIPKKILNIPEFKEKVKQYVKDNPPNDRINSLFFPFIGFLDEGFLEDKEFIEKERRWIYI